METCPSPSLSRLPAVVRDKQTRSMLQTDQRLPGVVNLVNVKAIADKSYAICHVPRAPQGMYKNRTQTVPEMAHYAIVRHDSPLETFSEQI